MSRKLAAAAAAAAAAFVLAVSGPALASAEGAADSVSTATNAERITAIGEVRRGSMVTIEGVVQRILDTDEFVLADASGKIRVDVRYPNFVPVAEGERVKVRGFVDRDLLREVYAREIVHADGRISRLDRASPDH
jgi:uncharacterized protein YdeI (BOF family)